MFEIEYSKQTKKFLKNAEKIIAQRIIQKIETLQDFPITHDTKRIEGYQEKLFRGRIGDYRIIYEVDQKDSKVGIVKIDKRSSVYKE